MSENTPPQANPSGSAHQTAKTVTLRSGDVVSPRRMASIRRPTQTAHRPSAPAEKVRQQGGHAEVIQRGRPFYVRVGGPSQQRHKGWAITYKHETTGWIATKDGVDVPTLGADVLVARGADRHRRSQRRADNGKAVKP